MSFLVEVFRQCENQIEIRAIFPTPEGCPKRIKQEFFTEPEDAEKYGRHLDGTADIYFGACTRTRSSGKKEDVSEMPGVWVDIDKPEALKALETFPLVPSIVVETSPGHAHGHWIFKEPLELESPEIRKEAEAVLKGLARALDGDPACAELARVMRLPGTRNRKRNNALIHILAQSDHRYNLSDFVDLGLAAPAAEGHTSGNGHGDPEQRWIAIALQGVNEGERHDTGIKLAGYQFRASPADIARAHMHNYGRVCRPPMDPAEVDKICDDVIQKVEQERATQSSQTGNAQDLPIESWPEPVAPAAYHGVIGEIVQAIATHTEADPVAILVQMVVGFGNLIGGGPFYRVEGTDHHANENVVLLGNTGDGRKGTSTDHARRLLNSADPDWERDRIMGGLSSGEGLIDAVRDAIEEQQPIKEKGKIIGQQTVITDEGVRDKRLLVYEPEFSRVLQVAKREGSTLSTTIRQAFDTPILRVMTRGSKLRSTGAHISIIGHTTPEEVVRHLEGVDAASGFANRFLWPCVRRSQLLPEGGDFQEVKELPQLLIRLEAAATFAKSVGEVKRDADARKLWIHEYERLTTGAPGLLGAMLSRKAAHVVRLSLIYALAQRSREITREHLEAAIALWDYCERSCRFIFGDKLGDPTADVLLQAIRARPAGMTRTEMRDHFGRNKPAAEVDRALSVLARQGLAKKELEPTGGRPIERWKATLKGVS